MNISNLRAWLIIALALVPAMSPATPATDSPIARLFFTPQERDRLDVIRYSGVEILRPTTAKGESIIETVTVSGIVQKRGGGLRAWLNGKSLDSDGLDIPVRVGREMTADRQLPLKLPGGQTANPKVGQFVNMTTGELHEGYQLPATIAPPSLNADQATAQSGTDEDTGGSPAE